jgi:hypothetical protein
MSILAQIILKEKLEKRRQTEARKEYRIERATQKRKLDALYKKFSEAISDLHGATVRGRKILLKRSHSSVAPKTKTIVMYANGKPWITFYAESLLVYCHCGTCSEGGDCGSLPDVYYRIKVEGCRPNQRDLPVSTLAESEVYSDASLANSMIRLIEAEREKVEYND